MSTEESGAADSACETAAWGEVKLTPGEARQVKVGPLTATLRRARSDEIWAAAVYEDRRPTLGAEPEWRRWAVPEDLGEVSVVPVMPDRAVVATPEVPFGIAPGAAVRIYVRIPVWLRLSVETRGVVTLWEAPTVELSDTWFGDPESGEMAYWLQTKARREVSDELFVPHLAMCALNLSNGSDALLPVERLAVRVPYTSVFRCGGRDLWTNELSLHYEADPEGTAIRIHRKPPKDAGAAERLAPARVPQERGFRARTFGVFRQLMGGDS